MNDCDNNKSGDRPILNTTERRLSKLEVNPRGGLPNQQLESFVRYQSTRAPFAPGSVRNISLCVSQMNVDDMKVQVTCLYDLLGRNRA